LLPKYSTDPVLGYTVEIDAPKSSIYKAVGFNDQELIKRYVRIEQGYGIN